MPLLLLQGSSVIVTMYLNMYKRLQRIPIVKSQHAKSVYPHETSIHVSIFTTWKTATLFVTRSNVFFVMNEKTHIDNDNVFMVRNK
jgi:hypothetical protein